MPIDRGPLGGEWVSIAALASERWHLAERYFAAMAEAYPGLDRRGQGAFLFGAVSYYLAGALAEILLGEDPLVAAGPEHFALRPDESGTGFAYRLAEGLAPSGEDAGAIAAACLAPLMMRLAAETRLGLAAQWRLLADSIASGFQEVGSAMDCAGEARAQALAIVQGDGPLSNPQIGYHRLMVGGVEQHYLKRGGCCRWYTADAGSYCASCVMREPEEQVQELMRAVGRTRALNTLPRCGEGSVARSDSD